jgi:hypothetical protein
VIIMMGKIGGIKIGRENGSTWKKKKLALTPR